MSGHTWSVVTQLNMADHPAFTLKQIVASEGLKLRSRSLKKPTLGLVLTKLRVLGYFFRVFGVLGSCFRDTRIQPNPHIPGGGGGVL